MARAPSTFRQQDALKVDPIELGPHHPEIIWSSRRMASLDVRDAR